MWLQLLVAELVTAVVCVVLLARLQPLPKTPRAILPRACMSQRAWSRRSRTRPNRRRRQ